MDDRKINPRVYLGLVAYALGELLANGTMQQDPNLATTFGYAGAISAVVIFVWFLVKSRGSIMFHIHLLWVGLLVRGIHINHGLQRPREGKHGLLRAGPDCRL